MPADLLRPHMYSGNRDVCVTCLCVSRQASTVSAKCACNRTQSKQMFWAVWGVLAGWLWLWLYGERGFRPTNTLAATTAANGNLDKDVTVI